MKRFLIATMLISFVSVMIAGCQVESRPWPTGKGILSSEQKQDETTNDQSSSSAEKHDSARSYDEEKIYQYSGSEYEH